MTTLDIPFASSLPANPACLASVVIPAQNEAELIGNTLAALVSQRDINGSPLAPECFEILVYANNCSDGTGDVVRAFAKQHPMHAIVLAEERLPPSVAHIGTARRAAMDAAASRLALRHSTAIIASTDADTIPAPTWLAWTLREMRGVDAVMGRILFDRSEWNALPEHIRRTFCEENEYEFTVTHVASLLAPTPYDPWPRHWQSWGPSFAVRVDAYRAAGGVPPVRALEDIALYEALQRNGARIRHSLRVRVTTSARLDPRVSGGFGTRIAEWRALGTMSSPLLVEHPDDTLERLRARAPLEREPRPRVPAPEATLALKRLCDVSH